MTEARAARTFPFVLGASFRVRMLLAAGLLALMGALALGSATPALAAHSPAMGNAPLAGGASTAPSTPIAGEVRPQEGEDAPAADDPQYAERDTSTDNTWIVLGVVLLIVLTVLGFVLAGLGLSAE